MKRYILTGTPGAGKTSLIRALAEKGYPVAAEAATDLIAMKQAEGIAAPWESPGFIDAIATLQKQRLALAAGPVQFHDRSAVCCYALAKYCGRAPSDALLKEIGRLKAENVFQQDVFFIRNLGFCEPTAARQISFEDSLIFEKLHAEAYLAFGYRLVDIEKAPLGARLDKILRHTDKNPQETSANQWPVPY